MTDNLIVLAILIVISDVYKHDYSIYDIYMMYQHILLILSGLNNCNLTHGSHNDVKFSHYIIMGI